jgi:peptidoglycan/LPS O-acetylase OafA/YrhL
LITPPASSAVDPSSKAVGSSAKYLPTLDGWRAVAIGAVLISHAFDDASSSSVNALVRNLGQQGVSIFFAISGFLITTLLLEELKGGKISLRGFYIRRVCRILPPAYIYLAVIGVLGLAGWIHLASGEIWSAAFFYSNYSEIKTWFTIHFWSLSIEEHFYLIWPMTLALAGVVRAKWIAVFGIVATLCWRLWSQQHGILDWRALERTDIRLDAFWWACLVAIVIQSRGRVWSVIANRWFHVSVLATMAVIYAVALIHPMQLTKLAVQSALMPMVIVPTVFLPDYWLSRVLEHPAARGLGKISYGVYLWQQLFFEPHPQSLAQRTLWFAIKMAVLLALTAASYRWIERPLIAFGRRRSQSKG